MRFLFVLFILAFLFVSLVSGQQTPRLQKIEELRQAKAKIDRLQKQLDQAEERRQQLFEELVVIDEKDREEAARLGAKAHRLFPDGMIDELIDYPEGGSSSVVIFDEVSGEYSSPSLVFRNGAFVIEVNPRDSFGFLADLGGTPFETIGDQSPEFGALAKYAPPAASGDVKPEFTADNLVFKTKAAVVVGNSYLIRAFNYGASDIVYALKVQRRDSDGSIVVFLKKLGVLGTLPEQPAPLRGSNNDKPSTEVDYEAVRKVQEELLKKGFYDVQLDLSTVPLTVRGTIPQGKMADVFQLIIGILRQPVRNEVTEK